ncbi:hypothetical protein MBLNU459_g2346t1 [Dothideomycetes sp. NU459]
MPLMTVSVAIGPGSDGHPSKWPGADSNLSPTDDEHYRTKLATKWMAQRGEAQPGMTYTLDKLPTGYRLFGKGREGSKHIDRYLCGHPKYKFRSTEEFYEHFVHLMANGDAHGCTCKGCTGPGSKRTSTGAVATPLSTLKSAPSAKPGLLVKSDLTPSDARLTSKPTATSKQQSASGPLPVQAPRLPRSELLETEQVDEEGTPDIWRLLVDELKAKGSLDKPIAEPDSVDWCIEAGALSEHIREMQSKPRWMPRIGEIVLVVRNLAAGTSILYDDGAKMFNLWDQQLRTFTGFPAWEAAVVVELPAKTTAPTIEELVSETDHGYQVSYSGFRVEPMPEIGNSEKPWSKRSAYVPLHHMRPFNFWREYTEGIPVPKRHPTLAHAMTATSSFSLLDKFHFKGQWPTATVFCKGIYIGPELILSGDIVRLLPTQDAERVTDVMQITAIKMKLVNLDDESETGFGEDDQDPPRWNTCIHVSGIAYTTDATRAHGMSKLPLDPKTDVPKSLVDYGSWYRLHHPSKRLEVPFVRLIGRCYEDSALTSWFTPVKHSAPSFSSVNVVNKTKDSSADLSTGLEGIIEARIFGTANDPRIARAEGKTWLWGDNRVQQLDLHVVHGHDVGANSRYGDEGTEGTLPRQAKHLDAMKRAKRAREKGIRGPYGSKGEQPEAKNLSGLTQRFAASTMVAGGMNALSSAAQSEVEAAAEKSRKRVLENTDGDVNMDLRNAGESNDDDMIADQLATELMGNRAGTQQQQQQQQQHAPASPSKRQRIVIELD